MKKKKYWSLVKAVALAVTSVTLLSGCRNYLVFSTATKFGLDASLRSDQQPELTFGYQRAEVVSIPLSQTNRAVDATTTNDAYSVLGTFFVSFSHAPRIPFTNIGTNAGIRVNQLFATGIAAQKVSKNEQLGSVWAGYAKQVLGDPVAGTNPPTNGAPAGGLVTNSAAAKPTPSATTTTFRIPQF